MRESTRRHYGQELERIRGEGLAKTERVLATPQGARIRVAGRPDAVLNLCANNYLGMSDHPELKKAAIRAIETWGYGLSSVRFICGTQEPHRALEERLTAFLGTEDTILYGSCFDANGGLFETLLGESDAVISDELNHASIIDGIRLCKATRLKYRNADMADLEEKLQEASGARLRLVATDGVFSMDGSIAPLDRICDLADRHDAMVMVDDSHAVGFLGAGGRGSIEYRGVLGRVDVITGTLGKALGGASGGYTTGAREIVGLLRQRSRPYLFSNTLAPAIVGASLAALDLVEKDPVARVRLAENTAAFRRGMTERGFDIKPGEHPIVPVMLYDARVATEMAERLLARGVYVIGFSFPVVPRGQARIRVQISAAHTRQDIDFALEAFAAVKKEMSVP